MVKYIIGLPGVDDPMMDDGTTAFAIAIGRRDLPLIGVLMASKLESDIKYPLLATRAILELDRYQDKTNYNLRKEITMGLKEHYRAAYDRLENESTKRCQSQISEE